MDSGPCFLRLLCARRCSAARVRLSVPLLQVVVDFLAAAVAAGAAKGVVVVTAGRRSLGTATPAVSLPAAVEPAVLADNTPASVAPRCACMRCRKLTPVGDTWPPPSAAE